MNVPEGAVLFDMDGVLIDSETYWDRFEDEWVFAEAVAEGTPEHDEITGMPYDEIYHYLDAEYGTAVTEAAFADAYEERAASLYGEDVALTDGVGGLFDALRAAGRPVGIVSSAPKAWIDIVRERFGLDPLDVVASAKDVDGPGKPDPYVYEHAAGEIGFDPADCIVVEDSVNGVAAAVRAGAFTVAFRSTHNAASDLSRADAVVGSPGELRELLLG